VTWNNQDGFVHTATSDARGVFDVTLPANGTGSHTFTTPGTFSYHCNAHPEMTHGTVVVT
jgi:plastocyanin